MKITFARKMFSSVILVLLSITLMVSVTFAWMTLSEAPEIAGIKLSIGGDNTILIAPDISFLNDDNKIVSYPGFFSKNVTLKSPEDALLSPVSTADGLNWFIPEISEDGQMQVQNINDFRLDTNLEYANIKDGGYAYVDFWVMSPLDNCVLRLCTGDEEVGSYVIELPQAEKNFQNKTGYNLEYDYDTLGASIRVGFLVNQDQISTPEEMAAYSKSTGYRNEVRKLQGVYEFERDYQFLIYEPNGLSHPNEGFSIQLGINGLEAVTCNEGEYCITYPIGIDDMNQRSLVTTADHLVVQTKNEWKKDSFGERLIEQMYQDYLKHNPNGTVEDFYQSEKYLNNNYLQYITSGNLFKYTWDLYSSGSQISSEDEISILEQSNVVVDSNIAILKKDIPQKIRMFVWIEGQDVDCNYKAANQAISIRLELAGSTGA